MDYEYLDIIRRVTFQALGHGASVEDVALQMSLGVTDYLNKVAELNGKLPSFSAKQIEETAIYSDGSK